ncbi:hypothetical protein JCM3774_004679 [Rhodotorula dairenensis]
MADRRAKGGTRPSDGDDRALPLSVALVVARTFALVGLATFALVVALAAWFLVKAALRVDPVVGQERVWLQYGHDRPPYAHVSLDPLKYTVPGPAYDLSLEATVPVNDHNLRVGNFMVSLSLVDSLGTRVVNVSRPAILNPSSASDPRTDRSPSRPSILRTLVTLPFSLVSTPLSGCSSPFVSHTSMTVHVPLLENVALASTVDPRRARGAKRQQSGWMRWRSRGQRRGGGPVEAIFVEVGRRDAYPRREADVYAADASEDEEGAESAVMNARDAERWRSCEPRCGGREVQIHEAWIKVQVKPSGLRALVHRHPWITFLFFFPTFLTLEAAAALSIYLYFVATASPTLSIPSPPSRPLKQQGEEREPASPERSGINSPVESEPATSATPSDYDRVSDSEFEVEREREDDLAARLESQRRQQQMRLGRGGVGMSAVSLGGEGFELEPEGGGEGEGERGSVSAGEEEAVGLGVEEIEEAEGVVKDEEGDEGASTIAASATTRRTASTFGPSVAGTSSSTGVSWPISQIRQRETAPRLSGRVDEGDEADP